jgi:hypothetical protein
MDWARILAYVTGTVHQELLARNEYRATKNRILRDQLKGRVMLGRRASAVPRMEPPGVPAKKKAGAVAPTLIVEPSHEKAGRRSVPPHLPRFGG